MSDDAVRVEVKEGTGTDILLKEKEAKIAELEAKIKELTENATVCKRCGRSNMDKPLKVREEIVKEYFRSLLGQRPFSYTLKALDGYLNIEFTLQHGESLLASIKDTSGIADDANVLTMTLMSTLTAVTLIDKEKGVSKVVYSAEPKDLTRAVTDYKEYYEKLVKSIDAIQLSVIRQASALFNVLVVQLMNAVANEDFYKGAGLD